MNSKYERSVKINAMVKKKATIFTMDNVTTKHLRGTRLQSKIHSCTVSQVYASQHVVGQAKLQSFIL